MRKMAQLGIALAIGVCVAAAASAQSDEGSIASGDLLFVDVMRSPEFSTTGRVDEGGFIQVPYVGSVSVKGLSVEDAQARVAEALKRFLRNPRVSVSRNAADGSYARGSRTTAMRSQVIPLFNKEANQLSEQLAGLVSEGGDITYDENTNSLIVTDLPENVNNIVEVISQLDQIESQLQQVRIAVKIAEVRSGALKELGVRWFAQGQEVGGGFYSGDTQDVDLRGLRGPNASSVSREQIGRNESGTGSTFGREFVEDDAFDRRLSLPVQIPKPGDLFFGLLNEHVDVGVFLDALAADDDAQVLAEPNILTANHKRAEIKNIDEFPYQEFATEASGRSTTGTKFLDIGIYLSVIPHVWVDPKGEEYVRLQLDPAEVSTLVGTSGGAPIRSVRSIENQFNLRDGQTLGIGGIYKNDNRNIEQRVPGLGKVPVLSLLFKRTEKKQIETELMIFVTPTVHDSPDSIDLVEMMDLDAAPRQVDAAAFVRESNTRREERRN